MYKHLISPNVNQTSGAVHDKPMVCYDETKSSKQGVPSQNEPQLEELKKISSAAVVKEVSPNTPVITIFVDEPLASDKPTTDQNNTCRHYPYSWLSCPIVLYFPDSYNGMHLPCYFDRNDQLNINNLIFITLLVMVMIMINNATSFYMKALRERIDQKFDLSQLSLNTLLELSQDPMIAQSVREVQTERPRLAHKIQDYLQRVQDYCASLITSQVTYSEFYQLLIYISNLLCKEPQLILLCSYSERVFYNYYHFTRDSLYMRQCERMLDLMHNTPSKNEVISAHHLTPRANLSEQLSQETQACKQEEGVTRQDL